MPKDASVQEQRGPSGATSQAAALRREGVEVGRGSLGEFTVDFATYGWFPEELPSQLGEEGGNDSDSEGVDA
ncbi:Alkyltransferase-like protein 1 [Cryomyces antarcticus]|uniref:Alkyltransferase-like protein 1 n=1 Tax=Cryomyces antarcticus TaxID=329879 RepID=A0ABR0M0U5_9PEZI|nr:Alkyltransferase-like protein 1 [Cryomyces antarcticus]KAK5018054.1 Alkyltransferase-like protein 1 [Cryomyces antarcticus]KAK5257064.1 Alkyltransferase-like protein 1 [Cryomyces antarcticus]